MRKAGKDFELRISGLGLMSRFALAMTLALTVVASIAGTVLYRTSTSVADNIRRQALEKAGRGVIVLGLEAPRFKLQSEEPRVLPDGGQTFPVAFEDAQGTTRRGQFYRQPAKAVAALELLVPHEKRVNSRGREEGFRLLSEPSDTDLKTRLAEAMALTARGVDFEPVGNREVSSNGVESRVVEWNDAGAREGTLFRAPLAPKPVEWIVPDVLDDSRGALLRIVMAVMALVVLVGAGVALWVGSQVAGPINEIVDDVRQISKGDLEHRTHTRGGGEVELLARSIDRMTRELLGAREAELELGIRQREMELAGGVREALLPVVTPLVEGYDVGAIHLPGQLGGDFHDYIELEDGRLGLLCCDVSGQGVPAALIGATARAYLRAGFSSGGDISEALRAVNRELVRDVRRGMYVTALYALLDPATARVQVACAGHKVPLLRFTAEDRKLRLVHPEGIALGFDKGPVFDRRLEVTELALAPGDRLLLANSGPIVLENRGGAALGEKAFYSTVLRSAQLPTSKCLRGIRSALAEYAGEAGAKVDVSLVTVSREA